MLYRDVPWPVAIAVLPGKIIGTFILNPINYFRRNQKRILIKWGWRLMGVVIISAVLVLFCLLLDTLTDGESSKSMLNFLHNVQDLFISTDPQLDMLP